MTIRKYPPKNLQNMNLFILSLDPARAAEEMMDKHVNKILLEAVQMLCTAMRVLEPELNESVANSLYKLAHKNHPVTIWCRTSRANFIWTLDLVDALHAEWKYRYGHPETKIHKSYQVALAMPVEYKDPEGDAVKSYRAYYMSPEKRRIATWTKRRSAPSWWLPTSSSTSSTSSTSSHTDAVI